MKCMRRFAVLVCLTGTVLAEQTNPVPASARPYPVDLKGAEVGRWTMDFEAGKVVVQRSDAYIQRLNELAKARQELEDWLLSRPANEPAQRARFGVMLKKLQDIEAQIAGLK